MNSSIPRRTAIKSLATGAAAVAATQAITSQASAAHHSSKLKGNINHSVCKWCYKGIELDPFCEAVKGMGLNAVDLIAVKDFPTLQKHGLSCSLVTGVPGGIKKGLNREENHETLIAWFEEVCPQISAAGYKQVICFSGNRDGMSDIQGLANSARGLNQIVPIAEKHGVTVVMELLNSKVNHEDYMADLSSWGVALCDTVGSDAFKLLYDIYHMQIMEGDVIATTSSPRSARTTSTTLTTIQAAFPDGPKSIRPKSSTIPPLWRPYWKLASTATSPKSLFPPVPIHWRHSKQPYISATCRPQVAVCYTATLCSLVVRVVLHRLSEVFCPIG